jgi:hypothetical protein
LAEFCAIVFFRLPNLPPFQRLPRISQAPTPERHDDAHPDTPYLEQTLPRFQLPIPPPSQPSRRSQALTPNSADLSLLFLQNTGRLLSLTLPQRNTSIDPTDRPNFSLSLHASHHPATLPASRLPRFSTFSPASKT